MADSGALPLPRREQMIQEEIAVMTGTAVSSIDEASPATPPDVTHVLAATDLEESSVAALAWARSIAQPFCAHLTIVHCDPRPEINRGDWVVVTETPIRSHSGSARSAATT